MNDLRQLTSVASVGVAHNGIIDFTSTYSKKVDYSDTMLFITDYLSLIIDGAGWHTDARRVELVARLASSKLAILDDSGHCELIGDFINDGGVYYSNASYKDKVTTKATACYHSTDFTPCAWAGDYTVSPDLDERNGLLYGEPVSAYNCGLEYLGDYSACIYCEDCARCHDYIMTFDCNYGYSYSGK